MPGTAFHLEVLRLSEQRLAAGGAADRVRAQLLADHPAHARLGAVGPDLLRGRPVPVAAIDRLMSTPDLAALSDTEKRDLYGQIAPNPEMAFFGVLYRALVPHYAEFEAIEGLLARLASAAAAEDVDALKALQPEFEQVKPRIDALQSLSADAGSIKNAAGFVIAAGRPSIQGPAPQLVSAWRPFEFLRWRRTGAFSRALVRRAQASGDRALQAYAAGWLSHVAAAVVGEPFVNSIVGGPYRTHWWRNRWVRNHVDGWVWGRYRTPASMAGDAPSPPYTGWQSLCRSDLQDQCRLDPIAGAAAQAAVDSGTLPPTPGFDPVAQLLADAAEDTYGDLPGPRRTALPDLAGLRGAYVGTLSMLWFMTSRSPLTPPPPGSPPAGAETPPSWYTSGGTPPAPTTGSSSLGATVSAVIAAILVVLALLTGSLLAAVGAIALAIAAALAGDPVDWAGLRSTVYWTQRRVYDAENALHKGLLRAGAAYPQYDELGTPPSPANPAWTPVQDQTPPDSGAAVALTRSRRSGEYPSRMDDRMSSTPPLPADLSYAETPRSPPEFPSTRSAFDLADYAERIIDGTGLLNGGLLADNGQFPTRDQDFGDAVSNAVALLQAEGRDLPSYNLDADRGYGWKNWRLPLRGRLDDPAVSVQVQEEDA
jgi:hypothetical protein